MTIHNFTYRLQPIWHNVASRYATPEWSKAVKDMDLTGQRICPKALEIAQRMAKIGIEVFPVIVPAKSHRFNFLMYAKDSGAYYFTGHRDDFASGCEVEVDRRFVSIKTIKQ